MMKRSLLLMVMALVSQMAFSQLQWKETIIDYGTFDEEEGAVEKRFECKNIGTYPVELLNVKTSCGCIAADFKKTTVQSGETYVLPVKYNPDMRPGYFDKTIYVSSPDTVYELTIVGNVRPSDSTLEIRFPIKRKSVRLLNEMVNFRQVERGNRRTVKLSGCNVSEDTIECQLLELPQHVDFEIYPEVIPPKNVFTMKFTLQSDTTVDFGLYEKSLKIKLGEDVLRMPVSASIVAGRNDRSVSAQNAPKLRLETTKIIFDSYGEKKLLQGKVRLENIGSRPLVVYSVSSQDKAVEVKNNQKLEILPGNHQTIEIEINTSFIDNNILNSELLILTNDPFNSAAKVRIVGMK